MDGRTSGESNESTDSSESTGSIPSILPDKPAEIENPSRTPLMWEKRSFARDGTRAVLFADGHVEKVDARRFRELIQGNEEE